jgi:MFS family permease
MTTLLVSQVCGSTAQSIAMAIGSIMAASIMGTNTWSGLPVAVSGLGSALASWPLSRLMNRSGRRPGPALGYGLAVIGAGLGAALVLGPLAVTLLRRPALGSASTARGR